MGPETKDRGTLYLILPTPNYCWLQLLVMMCGEGSGHGGGQCGHLDTTHGFPSSCNNFTQAGPPAAAGYNWTHVNTVDTAPISETISHKPHRFLLDKPLLLNTVLTKSPISVSGNSQAIHLTWSRETKYVLTGEKTDERVSILITSVMTFSTSFELDY